ncbi:response regulator [Dyadobacter sandarakinus]|uniref:Response regulator n=1 Tax=Dyadobacter sandarakinus TaxID=2747268 RepID=A0ABX7IDM4_9BACT|nr:response regulator [Dyadobacter sandarakinus]QRR03908.1 response regulator [Dyadobacter sandarakinus]
MGSKLKIILVDDDKIMLFLHEMFLKKSGVNNETILCGNGQEALDLLDKYNNPEEVFLVLLDINMPVMNGWEFLSAIRNKIYPHQIWVVMVSSATEDAERDRAFTYPHVIDYLQKPLTIESCNQLRESAELRAYF